MEHGIRSGSSPSGKALGFGPSIRRFESCRPSQIEIYVLVLLDSLLALVL